MDEVAKKMKNNPHKYDYLKAYEERTKFFEEKNMPTIAHIAVNHSTWDLELENLPLESLVLIYADFRVRKVECDAPKEKMGIFTLKESFEIILSKLENVDAAKERRYRYVYAKLKDFENYMETQEGKNLPYVHCIEGTKGWEIVPELQEFAKNAFIVDKPTFGYKDWKAKLDELFNNENNQPGDFPEEIELCGTCTSICVTANATILKSLYPEMPISVDSSCCACLNEETHNAALTVMKTQQIFVK